jgi:DNA mismatch repair protein MutS
LEKTKIPASKDTPLMLQYSAIKTKYPDAILLFRVGDFYETFGQDAVTTSKILGIVLTKRANGAAADMDLAGFPYHALDNYLPKLVRAGYRVAICDQLEDPKLTKTVVKRGVTELVTPGITDNDKILDHKSNNYLAAVHFDNGITGVAFLDISTGEFFMAQGDDEHIDKLLQTFSPSEIIFSKPKQKEFKNRFGAKFYTYALDDWIFTFDYTRDKLLSHFNTPSLKGFGVENLTAGIVASGAILHYLSETEHPNISHITSVVRLAEEKYVWLDKFTVRNLELIYSPYDDGKSLLQTLDHTLSPMGARLLRKWILMPLKDIPLIEERLNVVEHLIINTELTHKLATEIKHTGDLERLISKVSLGKIGPREVMQIRRALLAIGTIKNLCSNTESAELKMIAGQLNPCDIIAEKIKDTIREDAPALIIKGNAIADGVSDELDDLRKIAHSGKDYLINIQQREIERTGISSLKVAFNSVFGYYLEVTNAHKHKVPSDWIRKQTLVNAERYITPELKEYEEKILGAEEKILSLEIKLFESLILTLQDYVQPVQLNALQIAKLDCLFSFATIALKYNYRKPELNDSKLLDIRAGRHPFIEQQLPVDIEYVPNDIFLDDSDQQIIIITGPNMAGKSALLRQTALIVLMAQAGSFVPAQTAKIGIIDKIFTRVGASDNLSSGESTFMVEMNETASIINNISDRSLILLDEIGRGTSTYDGISIAWSIAEYLHQSPHKPKTLFATHYHELNELAEKYTGIKNYNVSIREAGNKVIFLRKLVPGGSQHSFGIHVAKMAGMPASLVSRANEILKQLEEKIIASDIQTKAKTIAPVDYQLNIFKIEDEQWKTIKEILNTIDINTITPMDALLRLNEIKAKLKT